MLASPNSCSEEILMDINRGGGRTRPHLLILHSKGDQQEDSKSPISPFSMIANPDLVTIA